MAYRIDFDSPLEDEARRIARELLSDAADLLERQPEGTHKAIHDARKNIKRTRALYRLLASELGDFQTNENAQLRDIANALSYLRDSAALAETTDYLEVETDQRQAKTAIRRLGRTMKKRRDKIAGARQTIEEKLSAASIELRAAEKAVSALNLPKLRKQSIECLAIGWQKTGKKALKALARCQQSDVEEAFHDLRKRTQDRFMHAILLRSAWPAGMYAIHQQAKVLVDILGREHDLAVLNAQVPGQAEGNPEDRQQLLQSIAAERSKLQEAARAIGKDIFDDKPKRDVEIIAMLIRNRR